MSHEIYARRNLAVENLYEKRYPKWVWFCIAVAALSLSAGLYAEYKKTKESEAVAQAAYEVAVSKAPVEIEAAFRNWTAISADDDVAVKWSGADSEILYIHFSPAGRTRAISIDEKWEVWARTKSGKIFVVNCWLNDNLKVVVGDSFKKSSPDALLKVLVNDKKNDLIEKLKFRVTPA